MPSALKYTTLSETTLYKMLHQGFRASDDADVAELLSSDVSRVCRWAAQRMKRMQALHEQYTLHDEVHLRRVTALMALVMPEEVLRGLNPIELALLILAAHLHDQGMIPDRERLERIRAGEDRELKDFERRWLLDNPKLREVREKQRDATLSEDSKERYRIVEQQLRDAMITDVIRRDHGRRSAEIVRERYGDGDLLTVDDVHLAPFLAKLCESHERPTTWISEANGFGIDERLGSYDVNLHYLAHVLRLADILDFDRDRVPEPLYKNINFTSEVSLREWNKHRSIRSWKIERGLIQFTAECKHPAYQKALYEFMDWIDRELEGAHSSVAGYGPSIRDRYHFDNLPTAVDRKRIRPRQGAYEYHDVEFSLSRDDMVQLLMTSKLYQSPSLCVRELLQNSLDALRHRKALYRRDGADLSFGGVFLEHRLDEDGRELLVCRDDGVGMDVGIVRNFLTRVGRSYYRSPQFEWEREKLRGVGEDFDPCARFGIGFMSCFMLGDKIKIRTRIDRGPSEGRGDPLEVEITSLDSMLVIRKGPPNLPPGTEVEVTIREKPLVYNTNTDQVKLTEVVEGYAVACEFPIEARCTIPGIESEVRLSPGVYEKPTEMEQVRLESRVTLEQDFREIDSRLQGKIRISFLRDEHGNLAVRNDEARWSRAGRALRATLRLLRREEGWQEGMWNQERLWMMDETYTAGHVCLDGIVVSGALRTPTGRGKKPPSDHNPIRLGRAYFTLDVRGDAKPPLTPARTPDRGDADEPTFLGRTLGDHPGWLRLRKLAALANGRLWEQVAERCSGDPELLWQLAAIHETFHQSSTSAHPPASQNEYELFKSEYETGSVSRYVSRFFLFLWMRAAYIWSYLHFPVGTPQGGVEWRTAAELGRLYWRFTHDSRPIQSPTPPTSEDLAKARARTIHRGIVRQSSDSHVQDPPQRLRGGSEEQPREEQPRLVEHPRLVTHDSRPIQAPKSVEKWLRDPVSPARWWDPNAFLAWSERAKKYDGADAYWEDEPSRIIEFDNLDVLLEWADRADAADWGDEPPLIEGGGSGPLIVGWDEYTFLEPLLGLSSLTLDGGEPVIDVREPSDPDLVPGEYAFLALLDTEGPANPPLIMSYSGDLRGALTAGFVRQSLNRDHAIIRLAVAAQYKERLTEVERFAESLVRYATDLPDFYDAVAEAYPSVQEPLRHLGAMYRAVDWSNVDEKYRPPYKIWSRERGFDFITEDRLIEWAKFEPRDISY
jgi:hypothetical protein